MAAQTNFGIAFWGFLAFYSLVLYAVAAAARTVEGFLRGRDARGRQASRRVLTSSISIVGGPAFSLRAAGRCRAAHSTMQHVCAP